MSADRRKAQHDKFAAETLFEAGRLGANADVNHPLRKIWEAARAYYQSTGDMPATLDKSYTDKAT